MPMSERERQMMLDQLRGMTSNIGGAATPLASIMPSPAKPPQGTISPQDLAKLGKMKRKPSNAMEAAMAATSPTMGTALAKAVVSGIAGHRGRKAAKKEASALEKAMQKKADEFEVAQARKRDREDASDRISQRELELKEEKAAATATTDFKYTTGTRQTYTLAGGELVSVVNNPQTGRPEDSSGNVVDLAGAQKFDTTVKKAGKPGAGAVRQRGSFRDIARQGQVVYDAIELINKSGGDVRGHAGWQAIESAAYSISPYFGNVLTTLKDTGDIQGAKDLLNDFSAELLHDKYGGQLTGGETSRGGRWDPSAFGIDDERTLQRLMIAINAANDSSLDIESMYEDYDWNPEEVRERARPGESGPGMADRIDNLSKEPGSKEYDALTDAQLDGLTDEEIEAMWKHLLPGRGRGN